ncbi:lipocalin-like domain-containing protein [Marinobacter fonticola]|uniref:lipocalin-like domain-containing protein n=1 Tax=Marinobacter fonticola TaxID=2603215 RepID=UPI0011E82EA3|nr:lipocalin-like domain-containing protein [Marinobacter fonticola]
MSRPIWVLILLLTTVGCSDPSSSQPEGFAGLGESLDQGAQAQDFAQPGPGDGIQLPRDLGPHPAHRIEWWYLTANLTTEQGTPVGLQWTQFRQALVPRSPSDPPPASENWPLESVWMAHAALSVDGSSQGQHLFSERVARGDIGHAGARAQPFTVWLDDWQLTSKGDGRWHLQVDGGDWSYDLILQTRRPPVRHGEHGFSAKSGSGEGSMYFSYVDLAIAGTITVGGETQKVSGGGWFDREWSSQFLRSDQTGWDWMALRLDSGARVMAFRLREAGGAFSAGTWISPKHEVVPLQSADFELEVEARRKTPRGAVPVSWRLRIPSRQVDLTIRAMPGNFWNEGLYPYWESPVRIDGSHRGRGYLELTGYDEENP